ncbi:MAG: CSLREA domain-containing protein [Actinomycetota bacterium]|nr:CSLREA domain-containing protein [Actinomycetota bacterium]
MSHGSKGLERHASRTQRKLSLPGRRIVTIAISLVLGLPAAPAFAQTAPPPNDNFADAQEIFGETGSVTGTNVNATSEPGEPFHRPRGWGGGGHSIWYRWTAPDDKTAIFDTAGSVFDTVLAAYTGHDVASLTKVVNDDDSGPGSTSSISLRARAGTVYHIAVDTSGSTTGGVVLNWEMLVPPANDDFANADPVIGDEGTLSGSNVAATSEPGEPEVGGGHSIWYRWTAPQEKAAVFDTAGSDFGTVLSVYTGNDVGSLTRVARAYPSAIPGRVVSVNFRAKAQTVYHIAVDGFGGEATGAVVLNWKTFPPPANDDFADAEPISGDEGSVSGYNFGATSEPGEPAHAFPPSRDRSIWYRWQSLSSLHATFDTEGSDFDTVLAVYIGSSVDRLTEVASDDNSGLNRTSRVSFTAVPGVTYHIAIDGSPPGNTILNWGRERVVTSPDDTDDGVCGGISSHCTLREAINASNRRPGRDTITFAIPGPGPHTITPASPLPQITDPTTIDGTTQRESAVLDVDPPVDIQITGTIAGSDVNGLWIKAGNTTVQGLVINGFGGAAVRLEDGGDNVIAENFLGTDAAGTVAVPNGYGVRIVNSANNQIGGYGLGGGGLMCGYGGRLSPVRCELNVGWNFNVISGSRLSGVSIEGRGTGNRIRGNLIGTGISLTTAIANGTGIEISSSDNVVEGNHVSGNRGDGVAVRGGGASGNRISANLIGLSSQPSNGGNGISIEGAANNRIGGIPEFFRRFGNLISANGGAGLSIAGSGATANLVQGNYIGVVPPIIEVCIGIDDDEECLRVSDPADVGNSGDGVSIGERASGNLVGGTQSGAANVIGRNHGDGVRVDSGGGNGIVGNRIFSNGGLGIDLGGDGVSQNDPDDGDDGPNLLQNFPVVTAAAGTTVKGKLVSRPNTDYRIELFAGDTCDPSGHGEGEVDESFPPRPWEVTTVITDRHGKARFSVDTDIPAGYFVTATATDPSQNTSEFSACLQEGTAPADLAVTTEDSPDPVLAGQRLTYRVGVTNDGPADATGVQMTDTLPAGVRYESATPSQGTCDEAEGVVSCELGDLVNGASASIDIVVRPPTDGTLFNRVRVIGDQVDPNSGNDTDTETTTVDPAADVGVTMTASPDPTVHIGKELTYTLTVSNAGPNAANGVTLEDQLPKSAGFGSVSASQGTCMLTRTTVTCDLGSLTSGASTTVTIVIKPTAKGEITNAASVASASPADPDTTNNRAEKTTNVVP